MSLENSCTMVRILLRKRSFRLDGMFRTKGNKLLKNIMSSFSGSLCAILTLFCSINSIFSLCLELVGINLRKGGAWFCDEEILSTSCSAALSSARTSLFSVSESGSCLNSSSSWMSTDSRRDSLKSLEDGLDFIMSLRKRSDS